VLTELTYGIPKVILCQPSIHIGVEMITLNGVLKVNAASCIGFGVMFLMVPSDVSVFLSADVPAPILILQILGIGLFINGIHLLWASLRPIPSKSMILYFSIGDFLWAIASISLLMLGVWITTTAGVIVSLLVAATVATLGVLQMIKRKEMGHC